MSVVNVQDDNEMIQGALIRSPGICLTAEENSDQLKGLYDLTSPQMNPFLPNEVGSIAQHAGIIFFQYCNVFGLMHSSECLTENIFGVPFVCFSSLFDLFSGAIICAYRMHL